MIKVEEALKTTKDKNETWQDVFDRINKYRGIDVKTLTNVVIAILEELEAKEQ
jgi:hypothetical protein